MRPAFGDWRSLVAHFVRDEGVGGSNPLSPTKFEKPAQRAGFFAFVAHEDENLRGRGGSTRAKRENVAPATARRASHEVASNPLSPTKFEKPAQRAGFFASVTHEEENLRGRGDSTRAKRENVALATARRASNPLSPTNLEKPAYGLVFCFLRPEEDENLRGQGGSIRRRPDKTRQRRIRQMCRPIVGCGVNTLFDLHTTHFPAKFAPHISLSINGFVTETIVFFYICLNLFLRYLWLALAFSAVRFSVHGINRSDIHLFLRFFSLNA